MVYNISLSLSAAIAVICIYTLKLSQLESHFFRLPSIILTICATYIVNRMSALRMRALIVAPAVSVSVMMCHLRLYIYISMRNFPPASIYQHHLLSLHNASSTRYGIHFVHDRHRCGDAGEQHSSVSSILTL